MSKGNHTESLGRKFYGKGIYCILCGSLISKSNIGIRSHLNHHHKELGSDKVIYDIMMNVDTSREGAVRLLDKSRGR